jgi:hypothetical protein
VDVPLFVHPSSSTWGQRTLTAIREVKAAGSRGFRPGEAELGACSDVGLTLLGNHVSPPAQPAGTRVFGACGVYSPHELLGHVACGRWCVQAVVENCFAAEGGCYRTPLDARLLNLLIHF